MSFSQRDIRPSMDVYTLDGVYLGTVLRVIGNPGRRSTSPPVPPAARQSSRVSGEALGPMPTAPLGNPGPRTQSAAERYAVADVGDDARAIDGGAIIVGRWWGLRARRTIPLDAIQTVSMERVVLRHRLAELDERSAPPPQPC